MNIRKEDVIEERFYKNPEQDAAFSRCIDAMTRLIQIYGPVILAEVRKADEPFALPHRKCPRNMKYLQSYLEYICRHKKNDAAYLICTNNKLHVV